VPPLNTTVAAYENLLLTSTQAMLFRDDAAHELILAFPGTASFDDQLTDILALLLAPNLVFPALIIDECRGCTVHLGVLLAWLSILAPLRKTLDALRAECPDYRLTITGHSLGGAIATLAYASLRHFGYDIAAVYTFGQPRTGNPLFASHIDALAGATETAPGVFFRSTHGSDGVPQLPTQFFGYRHSRTEYWEDNVGSASEGATSTWRCFGQEAFDCNDAAGNPLKLVGQGHGYYGGVYMVSPR